MNRLAFREMSDTFGKWRDDESVTLTKTRHMTVQSNRDVPLFLDGERVNVSKKAEISFVSDVVNLIVPKPNQGISLFADFKCNLLQRGVRIY